MSAPAPLPIVVLLSGSGSNLQAIIDAAQGDLPVDIRAVISNRADAYGLERARNAGIPARVLSHQEYADRESYDEALMALIDSYQPQLVVLAGFMRIITSVLLDAFPARIINIHPALLPAFPGLHVQQQALDYGARFSGCTVHFVDGGVDTGPIIIQAVVPIHADDTAEALAARILQQEHLIYPRAIELIATGRVRIEGRAVVLDPPAAPPLAALVNPPLAG